MEQAGDVLVVGAGPVGVLTALALAQEGVKATVVEAEPDVVASPRASAYFASTLVALERLGLLPDLEPICYVSTSFGFRVPAYDFVAVVRTDPLKGLTFDHLLHCGQDRLAHVVIAHARKLGVDVRFGWRVTDLSQSAAGATATVETAEGTRELAAKWIVGADGARSTLRRLLDIEFEGGTWPNRFVANNVLIDFERYGYEPNNFVCDPVYGGVVARIDTRPLWRVTYQEDAALPAETFEERRPERFARLLPEGAEHEVVAASPYAIHQRAAARLRAGRVLLAGDAAHATNPLGGMGLTTGIWDGMILADVLAAVIRGEEDEAILDRYSDERRRVFWEVSSPNATENKRVMEESDPAKREADMAAVKAASENPELARMMMLFPFRVIGDPLRKGSRWADADPTPAAGVDITGRKGQIS